MAAFRLLAVFVALTGCSLIYDVNSGDGGAVNPGSDGAPGDNDGAPGVDAGGPDATACEVISGPPADCQFVAYKTVGSLTIDSVVPDGTILSPVTVQNGCDVYLLFGSYDGANDNHLLWVAPLQIDPMLQTMSLGVPTQIDHTLNQPLSIAPTPEPAKFYVSMHNTASYSLVTLDDLADPVLSDAATVTISGSDVSGRPHWIGNQLFFGSAQDTGDSDLAIASQLDGYSWLSLNPIVELNSTCTETAPFLATEDHLFFASDRGEVAANTCDDGLSLWHATRTEGGAFDPPERVQGAVTSFWFVSYGGFTAFIYGTGFTGELRYRGVVCEPSSGAGGAALPIGTLDSVPDRYSRR